MRLYFAVLSVLFKHGLTDASFLFPRALALFFPPLLFLLLLSFAARGQVNALLSLAVGTLAVLMGWSPTGGSPWWTHFLAIVASINILLVVFWPIREVDLEVGPGERYIRMKALPLFIPFTGR